MKANHIINKQRLLTVLFTLGLPIIALAQDEESLKQSSYFSNALFNTLWIACLLIAILIVALSGVLKNISNSDFIADKKKDDSEKTDGNSSKTFVSGIIILFSLLSFSSLAQENAAPLPVKDDWRIGGLDQFTFYFLITTLFVEIVVAGILIRTIKFLIKSDHTIVPENVIATPKDKTILDKLSDAVDIDKEETIMLDHEYDGIRELDNNLPPWWKYGFYLTIIVSIIYLINYHVIKTSPLQKEEYTNSVKQAEIEIAEYMKTSANNVDESTVKMIEAAEEIAAGKELFISNCAACHGKSGEGSVGPNLTDDYWLHGGSIQDVFKTIKYGWADKGMKSWKEDFSPIQIAQLSSFIKTIRGTNPANPKEKQGDLYVEQVIKSDSLSTANDSLKITTLVDTLKK